AGVHTQRHFCFNLLAEAMRPGVRRLMDACGLLVVAGIGGALAIWGGVLLADGLDVRVAGAPMPQSINFLPLSLGGALMCVFALARLPALLRGGEGLAMGIALLFVVFLALLVIGVPVAYALAAASLATLLYLDLPAVVLVQQVGAGIGTASLIAIPLFVFAGEIMMRGGISERLIALAAGLVGRMRGGLG